MDTMSLSLTGAMPWPWNAVEKLIDHIEHRGGLESEGIYRIPGSKDKVSLLRNAMIECGGKDPIPDDVGPAEAASTIKWFLSNFELLPVEFQKAALQAAKASKGQADEQRASQIAETMKRLHQPNRCALQKLILHLTHIAESSAETKMDSKNLGVCFGPTLFAKAMEVTADPASMTAALALVPVANDTVKIVIDHAVDVEGDKEDPVEDDFVAVGDGGVTRTTSEVPRDPKARDSRHLDGCLRHLEEIFPHIQRTVIMERLLANGMDIQQVARLLADELEGGGAEARADDVPPSGDVAAGDREPQPTHPPQEPETLEDLEVVVWGQHSNMAMDEGQVAVVVAPQHPKCVSGWDYVGVYRPNTPLDDTGRYLAYQYATKTSPFHGGLVFPAEAKWVGPIEFRLVRRPAPPSLQPHVVVAKSTPLFVGAALLVEARREESSVSVQWFQCHGAPVKEGAWLGLYQVGALDHHPVHVVPLLPRNSTVQHQGASYPPGGHGVARFECPTTVGLYEVRAFAQPAASRWAHPTPIGVSQSDITVEGPGKLEMSVSAGPIVTIDIDMGDDFNPIANSWVGLYRTDERSDSDHGLVPWSWRRTALRRHMYLSEAATQFVVTDLKHDGHYEARVVSGSSTIKRSRTVHVTGCPTAWLQ